MRLRDQYDSPRLYVLYIPPNCKHCQVVLNPPKPAVPLSCSEAFMTIQRWCFAANHIFVWCSFWFLQIQTHRPLSSTWFLLPRSRPWGRQACASNGKAKVAHHGATVDERRPAQLRPCNSFSIIICYTKYCIDYHFSVRSVLLFSCPSYLTRYHVRPARWNQR
jgi:hypothetical protein